MGVEMLLRNICARFNISASYDNSATPPTTQSRKTLADMLSEQNAQYENIRKIQPRIY